jgi:drug/metabolite transporter (DMT)-like permease
MRLESLLFVLLGSVFHLGWNILTKKSNDKLTFLTMAVFPWSIIITAGQFGQVHQVQSVLGYLITSIVIHAIYFWSLTKAYHFSDLSFVYPFSRGIGSLFTFLGGLLLLKENISLLGSLGIFLCIVATFLGAFEIKRSSDSFANKSLIFTFVTGLLIASYLVIDKVAVTRCPSQVYLPLMLFGTSSVHLPFLIKQGRVKKEFEKSGFKILLAGFVLFLAYGLILYAMETAPVSYIVAARASGIIFSAVAGKVFFQEVLPRLRLVGIFVITLGITLISLA